MQEIVQPQKQMDTAELRSYNQSLHDIRSEIKERALNTLFPPPDPHALPPDVDGPTKHDQEKTRFDLLPVEGLDEVARTFMYGAAAYGQDNWRKGGGFSYRRCYSAMVRHLIKWLAGEDTDTQTGRHHLAHVAWYCLTVIELHRAGGGNDDRRTAVG